MLINPSITPIIAKTSKNSIAVFYLLLFSKRAGEGKFWERTLLHDP
jgi:hypothetical protein